MYLRMRFAISMPQYADRDFDPAPFRASPQT